MSRRSSSGAFRLLIGMVFFCGCAGTAPDRPFQGVPPGPVANAGHKGWWAVRFEIDWPENVPPAWHMDTLIAHRVIAPTLGRYRTKIDLWRFHRRAARDGGGHRFSFIFYTDVSSARLITQTLMEDPLAASLIRSGSVRRILSEDTRSIIKPELADTSDPIWPPAVRQAWPYYIDGVSRSWLELVEQTAKRSGAAADEMTVSELQEYYRTVEERVRETWETEGRHAYLHHLNAIFGYAPVIVYEKKFMKF